MSCRGTGHTNLTKSLIRSRCWKSPRVAELLPRAGLAAGAGRGLGRRCRGAALCVLSLAGSRLSARQGNKEVLETAIPCSLSLTFPATDPRAAVFTSSLPLCAAAKLPEQPDANHSTRKCAGSHQIKRPLHRGTSLALTLLYLGLSKMPAGQGDRQASQPHASPGFCCWSASCHTWGCSARRRCCSSSNHVRMAPSCSQAGRMDVPSTGGCSSRSKPHAPAGAAPAQRRDGGKGVSSTVPTDPVGQPDGLHQGPGLTHWSENAFEEHTRWDWP